jgi:hypothetical protein
MSPVSCPRNPDIWNTLFREAKEMELSRDNMSREGYFSLRRSWKPLIQNLN